MDRAAPLTAHRQAQLKLLHELGAIDEASARSEYSPGGRRLNTATLGGALYELGFVRSKVRASAGGARARHYWLTDLGVRHVEKTARPVGAMRPAVVLDV